MTRDAAAAPGPTLDVARTAHPTLDVARTAHPVLDVARISIAVRDYDEAIAFYTGALGFALLEDEARGGGKRWVVVAPRRSGVGLLLAKAVTPEQQARVGDQTGGRVLLFLHTDDFDAAHARMQAYGVRFVEEPRREPHGKVAIFLDLYGNRCELIEPAR